MNTDEFAGEKVMPNNDNGSVREEVSNPINKIAPFLLIFFLTPEIINGQEEVNLKAFEWDAIILLIIGATIGATISIISNLILDIIRRNRDKKARNELGLKSILKELELTLNITEGEDYTIRSNTVTNVPYEFPTLAWHSFFGDIEIAPERMKKIQEAYSAISKINGYAHHSRSAYSYEKGLGEAVVDAQRDFVKHEGEKKIKEALEALKEQIEK